MKCIVCGEHVPTGHAFVVVEGDLHGDGTFTARESIGALCIECGDPETHKMKAIKFPFTFGVA